VQNEILQEINNRCHIAAALNNVQFLANTGANDVAFQNLPAGADDPAALAAATAGHSLQAVGEVFNAATVLASGGISAANLGQITTDFTAVQQGLTNILGNATMLAQIEAGETATAAALTTVHLQTTLNQINLQLNKYDGAEATGSATALRGTADNLLDIIDIVQGDANLNTAAGGNGAAGTCWRLRRDAGRSHRLRHQVPGQSGADQLLGGIPVRGQHHQRASDGDRQWPGAGKQRAGYTDPELPAVRRQFRCSRKVRSSRAGSTTN